MKCEQASAEGTPVVDHEVRRFTQEDMARNTRGQNSVPTGSPRTAHLTKGTQVVKRDRSIFLSEHA